MVGVVPVRSVGLNWSVGHFFYGYRSSPLSPGSGMSSSRPRRHFSGREDVGEKRRETTDVTGGDWMEKHYIPGTRLTHWTDPVDGTLHVRGPCGCGHWLDVSEARALGSWLVSRYFGPGCAAQEIDVPERVVEAGPSLRDRMLTFPYQEWS